MSGAPEGSVAIRLTVSGGTVRAARVAVHRPTDVAAALRGKTVAEALRLIPLLFSVCGMAQGIAALSACEAALGLEPAPGHRTARTLLVLAETLASHAWNIFMDGPHRLGEPPAPQHLATLRAVTAGILPALYPERDHLRPGGGTLRPNRASLATAVARLDAHVAQTMLGGAPFPAEFDDLATWAGQGATPAARLLRRALDAPGFGACAVAPLADRPAAWYARRLTADPGFGARPHDGGAPAHTGPLARMADQPPVTGILERFGSGLAAHATARLAELAGLPARIAELAEEVAPAGPGVERTAPGEGAGVVETARGRLAHWVRLEQGRIADYRTAAPTEWNFHPDGPLARGLVGASDSVDLLERAGLLAAALDPCVAFGIDVEREG
ncbi:nickel-dependent hydrogenase large subunit [Azospirillum sp.]|uniref:nickel-dependent hydrogenase large subunit n=1 Tax=Azospirillum sp. TaxID=34012 RepID=UPI003D73A268